jgi:hypothetical protein
MDLGDGWHRDPFGVHEFRLFKDGQPTGLVIDNGVESRDEPPDGESDPTPGPHAEETITKTQAYMSPPDWYRDPSGDGLRYWDGVQWTEHVTSMEAATPMQPELTAISDLTTLVEDEDDQRDDVPPQPEASPPEAPQTPLPPSPGWWLASDMNWYPPEQHPNYVPPPVPSPSAPTPEVPVSPEQARPPHFPELSAEKTSPAPVPPPRTEKPFYKEPWFWVAIAAVISCHRRRRPKP